MRQAGSGEVEDERGQQLHSTAAVSRQMASGSETDEVILVSRAEKGSRHGSVDVVIAGHPWRLLLKASRLVIPSRACSSEEIRRQHRPSLGLGSVRQSGDGGDRWW